MASSSVSWEFDVKTAPLQGFLLISKIAALKATGLLTLEREALKKQIGFKQGEAILVRSNDPQDSFLQFLLAEKVVPAAQLKDLIKLYETQAPKPDLRVFLIQQGILEAARMGELQENYALYRLLTTTPGFLGKWSFRGLEDDFAFGNDIFKIAPSFSSRFMDKVRSMKDSVFYGHESLRREGLPALSVDVFPLPLLANEMKTFDDLKKKPRKVQETSGFALKLLLILQTAGLVTWKAESKAEEVEDIVDPKTLRKELLDLKERAPKKRYHELLGLGLIETADKIKAVYTRLIRRYHPDRMPSVELKQLAEEVFPVINLAFDIMNHPGKRAEYIASIELEQMGGVEALQKKVEAEMRIPEAQQLLRRRHYKQALEMLEVIHKALPDDGEVLADRVYAELMWMIETKRNLKGETQRLRQWINQALNRRSKYAAGYYYRGMLLKIDGQLPEALRDFERAIEIDPKMSEAQSEARVLKMRIAK